ncbi:unnamed protein product [Orchesella dallaii]|uniref:Uncharacterized protein n=1 Tax=Orchesella dallaii TaxID=48710 RepID=A0ABP1R7E7_9HEXA
MSKKGQVGKPSSYLFYSEDDKYIADFFTSLGYVDLWSDTEAWIVVASKLSDRKGFKVNWLDVRNHWSVVDNLLEKMYNVTLVTREDFGMQADTTNFDKFRIFTYRLEEAKDQMRERSTKKRKTPETYKIMEPPVFPLLFASRNEGSSCLQKEGVFLPKQIFKGRRFYLLDTKDTFTGLTSRLSLEYLIRLHGGHVLERLEDMKRATCIAGRNEKLNQKLCGEIHDNLYLPSLVYQHVDDEKAMSSESQMDHVWLGIIESNDAMLAVSDDGEECEAPCANTLDVPESIEKRSSSEAADQMETEQRNVNQMGGYNSIILVVSIVLNI